MKRERVVGLLLLQASSVVPLIAAGLGVRAVGIAVAWSACVVQLLVSTAPRRDGPVMLTAAVLGSGAELLLEAGGLMRFLRADGLGMPFWLPPSWAAFGAAFGHVLARLRGRAIASLFFGAAASALALEAAVVVGEIELPERLGSRVTIATALGVVFAGLSILAQRLTLADDRRATSPAP